MTLPDNLFDPLGIVNSLKRAVEVLREQPGLFLTIHAVAMVVNSLIVKWLLKGVWGVGPAFQLLGYHMILCPAESCAIRAVAELYIDKRPALANCINHTISRLAVLLGACLLINLAICIPTWVTGQFFGEILAWMVFLGVGLYVTVVSYHTYPTIVVEHSGVSDSIGRSIDLTKENRVHILLILLIYAVCSIAVLFVVGMIPIVGRFLAFLCSIVSTAYGSV